MHAAALHLVRRGYEAHQNAEYQMPTWGVILLGATVLLFMFANIHVEYTFGRLIPTLVMVESTKPVVVEAADAAPLLDEKAPLDQDEDAKDVKDIKAVTPEPEVLLVKEKPITSKLCKTIRHLRRQGGCLARYRGFAAFGGYAFASSTLMNVMRMSRVVPHGLAPILTALICANLATAWTHVVISMPSNKSWYKRIPGFQAWKKVAGPTTFFAFAKHMTCMVPMALAQHYSLAQSMDHRRINAMTDAQRREVFQQLLVVGLSGLGMALTVLLPAKVILTRVQASLLSEEDETIVPFDRTFDGRVVTKEMGGDGVVSIRDAWKTFAQESKVNLYKTYGKVFAMEVFLFLTFAITICGELVLILGDDIKRFIPADARDIVDGQ